MKKLSLLLVVVFLASFSIKAQTADEILDTYFENIGGKENFQKLKGLKFTITANAGGMIIPAEMISLKNGNSLVKYQLQGMTMHDNVFDGETLWKTNQMNMKAEKSTKEDTDNYKLAINDFPEPFLNYKEKGYQVNFEGKETIDGTETFKIKLTKKQLTINGKKEDDISYFYFDTENFVPIASESEMKYGPAKGIIMLETFSDYQEVDGLYFAHSIKQGVKGQPSSMTMVIDKIELNPTIDNKIFTFPETTSETKE